MSKKKIIYLLIVTVIFCFTTIHKLYSEWQKQDYPTSDLHLISLHEESDQDLAFLFPLLKEKRFVLLGESSHGVNEYSVIKLRLIKYLHEKLNFNTIFFESGISECAYVNEQKNNLSAEQMVKNALFYVWHTEENIKLMQYIKSNHMNVFGLDNQYTSELHSEIIKLSGDKLDSQNALQIYTLDTMITHLISSNNFHADRSGIAKTKFESLKRKAHKIYADFISKIDTKLNSEKNAAFKFQLLLLKKILINKLYTIDAIHEPSRYFSERDQIMTSNFKFLADTLNKNAKIIVWAHNSHISKTGLQNPNAYLGKYLQQQYDSQLYGIGLYAYRGELMDNQRRGKITLPPPVNNGLEYYLHQLRKNIPSEDLALFKNFDRLSLNIQSHWIQDTIPAFGWSNAIVPINEYNGVILIERAHPPNYID